jgi:hypothetical protein
VALRASLDRLPVDNLSLGARVGPPPLFCTATPKRKGSRNRKVPFFLDPLLACFHPSNRVRRTAVASALWKALSPNSFSR